ncbi:hypothetical protein A2454_04250 [Candidatus Peribacteria bacterium RIFOXYC2_FULL_55_14]|nr:MAG: hypothetical protein UY87_C0085G0005 [Candidatus Peribacteria bacterium GW2011_GWC2_54_8]KKW38766.1 MAG: hypothetical protein UY85_C0024G0017 [Candidatus Peribacteria bacterium GW2011_GWB1_54_5]KKW43391.1 MAG: hypothetical protein UY90_C0026G0002 [Candidatus Peregrinibacteria bacterium GW2011_GWA2_54_9]OGJ70926.1 MAG: hypothetical protein A2198_00770 [Candidatus Peribacteria bacterium RIFOXYA1_FULL_56_14]OGJ74221.1 MAG: hypothetical protein A2384_05805 [Candidatus Peribacteria bacterium
MSFEGFAGSDKAPAIEQALQGVELGSKDQQLLVLYFAGERRATIAEALGLRSAGSLSGMLAKAKQLLPPDLLAGLSGGLIRFRDPVKTGNPLQSSELDALDFHELACLTLHAHGKDLMFIAGQCHLSEQDAAAALARALDSLSPELRERFLAMRGDSTDSPDVLRRAA